MTSSHDSFSLNLGYARLQFAKAFVSHDQAMDDEARENALKRIGQWQQVLQHMVDERVKYGSRTPLPGVPAWVTLEVVTGGFATGAYVAGGPLQEHEKALLSQLPFVPEKGQERLALNSYFLTDEGLGQLTAWLGSSAYDVMVPEEAALLTVAYLVERGRQDEARGLVETIAPWFAHLRFYPMPLAQPKLGSTDIRVQDVEDSVKDLQYVGENLRLLAQKEAVQVWAPFKDRMVDLFLRSFEGGKPCQNIDLAWKEDAAALLEEFDGLRKRHTLCGKVDKRKTHFYQLRVLLQCCLQDGGRLNPAQLKQIALMAGQHVRKYGELDSAQNKAYRKKQQHEVAAPAYGDIAKTLVYRFEGYPKRQGLDDAALITQPVTAKEAALDFVPQDTAIPRCLQRKLLRCLNMSLEELIDQGLVTSGEVIANILPKLTSQIKALGVEDARLRGLYTQVYQAFRRRRSLLLLNLEKQVQLEELPWVAAIEGYREKGLSEQVLAKETLTEVCGMVLGAFPQAILPNKLLQELNALAKTAQLNLPLTEELAADIFMGAFSGKFEEAVKQASLVMNPEMNPSLYARYYGIDYADVVLALEAENEPEGGFLVGLYNKVKPRKDRLLQLCEKRAGVKYGSYNVAENGMLLEQAQILTTHNLAVLWHTLGLQAQLGENLPGMVKTCFNWACKRLQLPFKGHHVGLISIKQSAYAWRQMVFFLSFLSEDEQRAFLDWAKVHLHAQSALMQTHFTPVLEGLIQASEGETPAKVFLGWSSQHELLEMVKAMGG